MTALELAEEIGQLYGLLKDGLDRSPQGLLTELDTRCQWLARSAELEAEAQYIHDRARGEVSEKNPDLNATRLREVLSRDCADEARLVKLAERLHTTLCYQMDSIRSILSYEKESRKQG